MGLLAWVRNRDWTLAVLTVSATVLVGLCFVAVYNRAYPHLLTWSSCEQIWIGPPPESVDAPYGTVSDCREFARDENFVGNVDVSAYLLLDTGNGLVALRVDYRDLEMARFYRATAVELSAAQVPDGLSEAELSQLDKDIAARGGVRQTEWIVHYGDG